MADKKYYIRVPEALVEVSEDVFKTSRYMDRHFQTLEEKDARNRVFSYDALDTEDMLGAELLPDPSSSNIEDQVIASMMAAKLRRCIALLPEEDRKLIRAIYYEGASEKDTGKLFGISQRAVSKRLHQILRKLQILIDG